MSRYDIESLLADVKTIMLDNLNTKIAAITTEKNDGISLETIDTDAYFFQTLDGKQINYDPFVYYGVRAIDSGSNRMLGHSPTILTVDVVIVLEDAGQDVNISSKMFRYIRALKEIFEENFDKPSGGVKLSVQSQVPIEIALNNDSYGHKACGVSLRADIG